ncbi:FMN-binding glutamate synthase family protein [Salinimicrobium terrae]|uniref:FMN-binding glutamate synthase family protein n=1 Tax=Salinimicrobium terrae TaxID=470866 RepID=UPI00056D99C2|nr:FMN-binding glutamate synthase family protein [Salinimicrobium terrae]
MRKGFKTVSLCLVLVFVVLGLYYPVFWWLLLLIGLPILIGLYDMLQSKNNVMRNFPLFGHFKEFITEERHVIQQAAIENSREGRPFNWIQRRIAYSRASEELMSQPYGSEFDHRKRGHEWLMHSNNPVDQIEGDLRFVVGGPQCSHPYSSSILNISAMSYGSLGPNAVRALNAGAHLGGFAHNTGEGGLTDYHRSFEGDLIWQIGTAYFGCRNDDGSFDPEAFRDKAREEQVKMIELKISQGAKPGMGGLLPAGKNTEEIARFRNIEPHKDVFSPPAHPEFSGDNEMLKFIQKLRELSGGKPVGFKLCLGKPKEFIDICEAILETRIMPDFITIDSSEGGTGAANYDFIHWAGMHVFDSLPFAYDTLTGFGFKKDIRLLASGKVLSSFDVVRMLALGADGCYSARAMMLSLGCVQALKCNTNKCPTGVTTLNPSLNKGLVVEDKKVKVANFHKHTIEGVKELIAAAGYKDLTAINRSLICRRQNDLSFKTLQDIYPYVVEGVLLNKPWPESYRSFEDKN